MKGAVWKAALSLGASLLLASCSELAPQVPKVELGVTPASSPVAISDGNPGPYRVGQVVVRLPGASSPSSVALSLVSPPAGVSLGGPTSLSASNTPASADLTLRIDASQVFAPGETSKRLSLTLRATPQSQGYEPNTRTFEVNLTRQSAQSFAFDLSASASPSSPPPGSAFDLAVNLSRTSGAGTSGTVTVSVEPPSGASGFTVTPPSATVDLSDSRTGATLTFQVSVGATVSPGRYTFTARAVSGSVTRSAPVTIDVVDTTPRATVRLGASSLSVQSGGSNSVVASVTVTNYTGGVTLTASGLPTGVTMDPVPPFPGDVPYTATLTFRAAPTATPGTYRVQIEAQDEDGNLLGRAALSLRVTEPPTLSIDLFLYQTSILLDGSGVGNLQGRVRVQGNSAFSGNVNLDLAWCQGGANAFRTSDPTSFTLTPSAPERTIDFVLEVPPTASGGTCFVRATATGDGGVSATATEFFTIQVRRLIVSVGTPIWDNGARIALAPVSFSLEGYDDLVAFTLIDGGATPLSLNPANDPSWGLTFSGITLSPNATQDRLSFFATTSSTPLSASGIFRLASPANLASGNHTFYLVVTVGTSLTRVVPVTITVP